MSKPICLIKLAGILVFSLGLLFTACKKKEIQGPQGDPGTPGGGGNANISSTVFAVNTSQWSIDTIENCRKATIGFTALTKEVVEKGAIKVYVQTATTWAELPFNMGDLFTEYGFDEGHLYLKYINI